MARLKTGRTLSVPHLLEATLIGLAVLIGSWGILVVLAARLPPGILKDLAGFLPACVTMLRRLPP
jgi:hypothetical protein